MEASASVRMKRLPAPAKPGSVPVIAPATTPIPNAATVLAIANGTPRMLAVMRSIAGSVTGDDSQNAMTGASGSPRRRSAAISGSTPSPQTGVRAPAALAIRTPRAVPVPIHPSTRSDQSRQCSRERGRDSHDGGEGEHALGNLDRRLGIGDGIQ